MKLSTKSRYGLRMLIDINKQTEDAPTTLSSIADRQNVSVNYLEQVASDLKRAGFCPALFLLPAYTEVIKSFLFQDGV